MNHEVIQSGWYDQAYGLGMTGMTSPHTCIVQLNTQGGPSADIQISLFVYLSLLQCSVLQTLASLASLDSALSTPLTESVSLYLSLPFLS